MEGLLLIGKALEALRSPRKKYRRWGWLVLAIVAVPVIVLLASYFF